MKYDLKYYINSSFYGCEEDGVTNKKERVVICRKPHKCMGGCNSDINIGDYALLETGFLDDMPVSCYTCIPCLDKWLDETMKYIVE
jgi:hypothetical protein